MKTSARREPMQPLKDPWANRGGFRRDLDLHDRRQSRQRHLEPQPVQAYSRALVRWQIQEFFARNGGEKPLSP
jgi:hypothetical protein